MEYTYSTSERTSETPSDSAERSVRVKQYIDGYNNVSSIYDSLVKRSYERSEWYYVVFKPFNDSYEVNKYANCLGICSDYLRSKVELAIMTREILAEKIHVNALVNSKEDLLDLDGINITKRGLKYKLHVSVVEDLEHRMNIHRYIFKESDERDFTLYLDHLSICKERLNFGVRGPKFQRNESRTPRSMSNSSSSSNPDSQVIPRKSLFLKLNC